MWDRSEGAITNFTTKTPTPTLNSTPLLGPVAGVYYPPPSPTCVRGQTGSSQQGEHCRRHQVICHSMSLCSVLADGAVQQGAVCPSMLWHPPYWLGLQGRHGDSLWHSLYWLGASRSPWRLTVAPPLLAGASRSPWRPTGALPLLAGVSMSLQRLVCDRCPATSHWTKWSF